jgi:hypothetical protein
MDENFRPENFRCGSLVEAENSWGQMDAGYERVQDVNGDSRILKWRYCNKAIFWVYIPLHSPKNRPTIHV